MNEGRENSDTQTAVDFQELLRKIRSARRRLGCSDDGSAWYRGHNDGAFRLVPSFYRGLNHTRDDEYNLYCRCAVKGRSLISPDESSWERLALFQHFGIPTRLLDWTECFAIALFFAIDGARDGAHLWVMNPFSLNQAYFNNRVVTVSVDSIPDYFQSFIEYDNPIEWPYKRPIAMEIPWANKRIENQRGYFTLHKDAQPLESIAKSCAIKIEISQTCLTAAREFCDLAGVDKYSVFPDLAGLGNYLKTNATKFSG